MVRCLGAPGLRRVTLGAVPEWKQELDPESGQKRPSRELLVSRLADIASRHLKEAWVPSSAVRPAISREHECPSPLEVL